MSGSRRTIALLCGAAWFAPPAQAADSRFDPHQQVDSRNDDAYGIASRVATQAVYGRSSAWARNAEHATIDSVRRADCARIHARVFVPERMVLAIYGDFHSADMQRLIAAAF